MSTPKPGLLFRSGGTRRAAACLYFTPAGVPVRGKQAERRAVLLPHACFLWPEGYHASALGRQPVAGLQAQKVADISTDADDPARLDEGGEGLVCGLPSLCAGRGGGKRFLCWARNAAGVSA